MKMSWKVPAVAGVIMFIVNILYFAVPFNKTITFWISDVAVVLAIISQVLVYCIAFKNNATLTSKVYGWPIMNVGIRFLTIIISCAIILILLSANIKGFPAWISVIIYAVLYGVAAIGLIASESSRNFVITGDMKLEEQTTFMRKLYAEINALKSTTSDRELVGIVTKLAELIRFSDPVSCAEVFEQEGSLYETFSELKESVKAKDIEKVKMLDKKFKEQLEERNSMCKYAKRGH